MSFPFNVVLRVFLNVNLSCALFPRRFLSEHGKIRWFVLCTMNLTVFGISHLLLSSLKIDLLKGQRILGQYILHCGTFELLMKLIACIQ